ncbi:c-type cytochrome [Amphritea sp. HPY]|uniref:c-type cytochrome n=1 Tax=Amphritea sp. HPY TaxID=3421652 RepID=UPI003D7CAFBB
MKKIILVTLLSTLSLPTFADDTCSIERGSEVFNKCTACHRIDKEQSHFVGPNLHDLAGRIVGSAEGFKYSRQLRKDSRTWNAELFDQFITAPAEMFPRTRMAFAGLKKSQERADLYCFIKNLKEASK